MEKTYAVCQDSERVVTVYDITDGRNAPLNRIHESCEIVGVQVSGKFVTLMLKGGSTRGRVYNCENQSYVRSIV